MLVGSVWPLEVRGGWCFVGVKKVGVGREDERVEEVEGVEGRGVVDSPVSLDSDTAAAKGEDASGSSDDMTERRKERGSRHSHTTTHGTHLNSLSSTQHGHAQGERGQRAVLRISTVMGWGCQSSR